MQTEPALTALEYSSNSPRALDGSERQAFLLAMEHDDYALLPNIVNSSMITTLRTALPGHQDQSRKIRLRNGVPGHADGSAHHVLGLKDAIHDFLAQDYVDALLQAYFEGPFIVNSYSAIDNQPLGTATYEHASRFHRDVRTFSYPFRLMINLLVMLDDFTLDNGATRLVPGSHRRLERPMDDVLEQRSIAAVGPAGSIVLFDSNLWHSAAPNRSAAPRRALTLTFTRPFMKQQLDYPRLLGEDFTQDPRLRQILGYNARVPENLDEWFQPPERRKYKAGQG